MLGDFLRALFDFLGPIGMLLTLYLIFVIDAAIFPALPEVFAVLFFSQYGAIEWDPFAWGLLILVIALAGEGTGNTSLYLMVNNLLIKKKRMPSFLEKAIKKWMNFLVVKDEKIILVNRVAPVVPFVGAFMATCNWSYNKSLLYILTGAFAKYSFLLLLVGMFNLIYDPQTAQFITVGAIIIVVALSGLFSVVYKKRMAKA